MDEAIKVQECKEIGIILYPKQITLKYIYRVVLVQQLVCNHRFQYQFISTGFIINCSYRNYSNFQHQQKLFSHCSLFFCRLFAHTVVYQAHARQETKMGRWAWPVLMVGKYFIDYNNIMHSHRTPTKYSTPPPKPYKDLESPTTAGSYINPSSPQYNHHFSVLKMISSQHLTTPTRKGSLLVQKSLSASNDQYIMEDRFIPSRRLISDFDMNEEDSQAENAGGDLQAMTVADIYSEEILGKNSMKQEVNNENDIEFFKNKNLLKFRLDLPCSKPVTFNPSSINELSSSYNKGRRINKNPVKVLDAPALSDDFYLNLIDWSSQNQLAVGLSSCIYLWNAQTSKVTRLCELNTDSITSVAWCVEGNKLAVGCNKGQVLIWDVAQQREIRRMEGHTIRIGSMAWSKKLLSTGSRDKSILQRDLRSPKGFVQKLTDHSQQICGLKWSKDDQYLASGGNDNKAIVWNINGQAINKFSDHKAAVKALAWSPLQHGLLATGGGTADRMIKLRNIFTGEILCEEDTGSQICNLEFSKSVHEVVSTHGYSQNEVNIWSYPNMKKVATLKGHSCRVLYLATSPDGSTIVTGAGDETLRFWNVFPSIDSTGTCNKSLLESGITFR